MPTKIRVRLAPSPTGPLHIGTARTALFNFLFARQNQGEFILRFEDTDRSRSTKEFEQKISADLKWLGIDWDKGPFYQIERLNIYQKYAEQLIKNGFAEKSNGAILFKAKKVLEKLKIDSQATARIFEKKRELQGQEDKNSYLVPNIGQDLIHGPISGLVADTILLRSSGLPTFHLGVVVDDAEMKISHVIRGDDHLPNTPLHIVLQKALGLATPQYAHLPLILNPDRTKMSKRKGAVDVSEYRRQGYLPEAIINFLALFGWAAKNDRQILNLKDLIKEFDLTKVQKSAAIFDIEKLNFLNGYYIRKMSSQELDKILRENFYPKSSPETLLLTKALQTRITKLDDVKEMAEFFFAGPALKKEVLIFKKSDSAKTQKGLQNSIMALEKVSDRAWYDLDELNKILADVVKKNGLENGDVFWPVRAALSGKMQSPSPVELLQILGKIESLKRIKAALSKL